MLVPRPVVGEPAGRRGHRRHSGPRFGGQRRQRLTGARPDRGHLGGRVRDLRRIGQRRVPMIGAGLRRMIVAIWLLRVRLLLLWVTWITGLAVPVTGLVPT